MLGNRSTNLLRLLSQEHYQTAEFLSDKMQLGEKTLRQTVRQLNEVLSEYGAHIQTERGKGYLLKVDDIEKFQMLFVKEDNLPNGSQERVWYLLEYFLNHEDYIKAEGLCEMLYVSKRTLGARRIQNEQYVPFPSEDHTKWVGEQEYERACRLSEYLEQEFQLEYPKEEVIYIAIHLAGKGRDKEKSISGNLIISSEQMELVQMMLEEVYRTFQIDLREDLELIVALGRHLGPLGVRLQYGMHLENPLLEEIRERYSLAYIMASQAGAVLSRYFKKLLNPDEIAYLALALELALERQRTHRKKKNILLVCASGVGTAKLLAFKMKDMFHDCIGEVHTCDEHSVAYQSFEHIDYVFTMVPIRAHVPVPISEMKLFMGGEDIVEILGKLKGNVEQNLMQYYPEKLFFTGCSFRIPIRPE